MRAALRSPYPFGEYQDVKPTLGKRTIEIRGDLLARRWRTISGAASEKSATMINQDHDQTNLSSAIRVYVFTDYCMRSTTRGQTGADFDSCGDQETHI